MATPDELDARRSSLSLAKRTLLEKRLRHGSRAPASSGIPRRLSGGPAPLSFAQRRLWFLDQLDPQNRAYNEVLAFRVAGPFDIVAFDYAVREVALRHDALRTTFQPSNGEPQQVVAAQPHPDVAPVIEDLRAMAHADRKTEALRRAAIDAARPFDLASGPLMRTTVLRTDEQEHFLIYTMHHIVADGWSLSVLIREMTAFYNAYRAGQHAQLSPLPLQYADFAHWQRESLCGDVLESELAYWTRQLGSAPTVLDLPIDRPRPAVQRGRGGRWHVSLPDHLRDAIVDLGRREQCTLFMTLLSAYAVLLARWAHAEDIVVGAPVAGRTRPELEPLIGLFVNTLALRVDASGDPTFRELLRRVRDLSVSAFAHQEMPFERLVEAINPVRSLNRSPIFQVMFTLENFPAFEVASDVTTEWLDVPIEATKFDLTLVLRESHGALAGSFDYDSDLFDEGTIARLAGHFTTLVESIVADPDLPLSQLNMLSGFEREELLAWSRARPQPPSPSSVVALFETQAARSPEAIAVADDDTLLTYAELNRRANRLARQLRMHGAGAEKPVCMLLDPSIDAIVTLVAVLKAGAVYVPIDPAYPAERVAFVIGDARPAALIARGPVSDDLRSSGVPVVEVSAPPAFAGSNLDLDLQSTDAAYAIYTSGSTGTPKGVIVEHGALAQHCRAAIDAWGLDARDRVLQFASLCFDTSIEQICAPLACGARVVIRVPGTPDPLTVYEQIQRAGITVMNPPTAWWRHLVQEWLRLDERETTGSLRLMLVSGEAMLPEDVAYWFNGPMRSVRLINAYGPTEATIHATFFDVTPECAQRERLPIGQPLPGRSAYILDARQQLVPIGVTGQLHLGGAGLARGYLNRPDLTSAQFVPNPFSEGTLMYRTGDTARYLSDGTIEFIGRADGQTKVRGFRVELGDIEATLRRHPAVAEAAVVAERDPAGGKRLMAYVAVAAQAQRPSGAELRAFAAAHLPEYMVPHAIVPLARLPISATGKIDRHALPDPEAVDLETSDAAPRNETERLLSLIWCDLLGRDRVGIHDNFFDAGGHSLSAIRAVFRVRDVFQLDAPLQWLFQYPTVAALAAHIREDLRDRSRLRALPPIVPRPCGEPAPLTFAQEDFFVFDRAAPRSQMFNVHCTVRLSGRVDEVVLTNSFAELIRRHEALRTTFHVVGGVPRQEVAPPAPFSLDVFEIGEGPAADRDAALDIIINELRYRKFDLGTAPLLQAALVHLADADSVVVMASHHIVFDGWSLDLVKRDLAAFYIALTEQRAPVLPTLPISYGDFAVWQRAVLQGGGRDALLGYWRSVLAGDMVPLPLPADRPRPQHRTFIYGRCRVDLSGALCGQLHDLGRDGHATLFMILTTALQALLHLETRQDDVRIATMTAGRTRPEVEHVVGVFMNTVILRTSTAGDPTVRELLARARATVLGALEHEELPFAMLRDALVAERQVDPSGLAQVLFVFDQQALPIAAPAPGLTPVPMPALVEAREAVFSSHELIFEIVAGPPISVLLKYDADMYDSATGERLVRAFVDVLEAIATRPDHRLSDLLRPAAS